MATEKIGGAQKAQYNTKRNSSSILRCENLSKVWNSQDTKVIAVEKIDLEVRKGEVLAIIGPSGCGKSTLLQMIAGLVFPTGGSIIFREKQVSGPDVRITLIYQKLHLFDWLSVRKNVEIPLLWRNTPSSVRTRLALQMIERVGLSEFADAHPQELSVGMQNRVAVARALVTEPEILLMDESLGSLDAQSRVLMQQFLLDVLKELKTTLIYVTHQIDEAVFLADRIAILTSRPARLKETILIDIPRDRNRYSKEFEETSKHIFDLLINEVGNSL